MHLKWVSPPMYPLLSPMFSLLLSFLGLPVCKIFAPIVLLRCFLNPLPPIGPVVLLESRGGQDAVVLGYEIRRHLERWSIRIQNPALQNMFQWKVLLLLFSRFLALDSKEELVKRANMLGWVQIKLGFRCVIFWLCRFWEIGELGFRAGFFILKIMIIIKKPLKVTVLCISSSLFSLKGLYSSTAPWVLESEQ